MDLEATARELIAAEPTLVAAWLADRPGAWGVLAGRAVLRHRDKLGRRLTEPERRDVWAALWRELERQRDRPPSA